ncbi:MAG: hypothetical protein OEZ28_00690, partial [Nitrospinota bacterium]|nr:hypothetical protein [Nitrospinota bacterium]
VGVRTNTLRMHIFNSALPINCDYHLTLPFVPSRQREGISKIFSCFCSPANKKNSFPLPPPSALQ